MHRRSILAAPLAALPFAAAAQPGPIRLVVPYPPGGSVDATARIIAARIGQSTGQVFIVENRAGANGTIGAEYVRRATPDGTVFLYSASIAVVLPLVVKNVPYDPLRDFIPVARVAEGPVLISVATSVPGATLDEVMRYAKANEQKFNFATTGVGGAGHIVTTRLKARYGIESPMIGYRGAGPALNDLAAGVVHLVGDPILSSLPVARAGRIRAVAVTAPTRSPAAPDIPTTAESGVPDLVGFSWYGLWAPLNTPADAVTRMAELATAAAGDPDVARRLTEFGFTPVSETGEAFARFQQDEFDRTAKVLREAGVVPE
ncbi:MAG: tripartite tricarboxylate transporter substrate binding protein [Acetobacteraceae bacterium]|nr:tripartite tricarboxylate transporter substrate binding protein [Acetobacteraceae bacterium]